MNITLPDEMDGDTLLPLFADLDQGGIVTPEDHQVFWLARLALGEGEEQGELEYWADQGGAGETISFLYSPVPLTVIGSSTGRTYNLQASAGWNAVLSSDSDNSTVTIDSQTPGRWRPFLPRD